MSNRATLQETIGFLQSIDIWHEFKFSDRQLQTVAPEFQDFGMPVLNEVLNQVKGMQKKPSPAQLMSMAKEVQFRFAQERQIEAPEEDPSTWMTSREYARTQGFETLKDLIKHKIEENNNSSKIKGATSTKNNSLDPSIEKTVDFWDSIGAEDE